MLNITLFNNCSRNGVIFGEEMVGLLTVKVGNGTIIVPVGPEGHPMDPRPRVHSAQRVPFWS